MTKKKIQKIDSFKEKKDESAQLNIREIQLLHMMQKI
jgi:hypothetical protein